MLIVIWAETREELSTLTFCNCTSVAALVPVETATDGSGGEMTTVAPGRKFVPINVSRTLLEPGAANPGETLVSVGAVPAAVTRRRSGFEVKPPPGTPATGVNAVMSRVPGVAISAAGMLSCICVGLAITVGAATPFTWPTVLATKFVPVAVIVSPAPPATVEGGLSELSVGGDCAMLIPLVASSQRMGAKRFLFFCIDSSATV